MAPLPALPIRPYLPSNVKCLVADDARLNRMLIEHALTKRCGEGWTVDNTDSGAANGSLYSKRLAKVPIGSSQHGIANRE